jgi:hypothetical protein
MSSSMVRFVVRRARGPGLVGTVDENLFRAEDTPRGLMARRVAPEDSQDLWIDVPR